VLVKYLAAAAGLAVGVTLVVPLTLAVFILDSYDRTKTRAWGWS
jgi:hypothetical protein